LFRGHVGTVDWDNCEILVSSEPFNPDFYQEKRFLAQLTPPLWEIVNTHIDWRLASAFGYNRVTLD
jgi:hypothetical protein